MSLKSCKHDVGLCCISYAICTTIVLPSSGQSPSYRSHASLTPVSVFSLLSCTQVRMLETIFEQYPRLTAKQKVSVADALGVRTRQVEVWFQVSVSWHSPSSLCIPLPDSHPPSLSPSLPPSLCPFIPSSSTRSLAFIHPSCLKSYQ